MSEILLSQDQRAAVGAIVRHVRQGAAAPFRLAGPAGSGKTQVAAAAIRAAGLRPFDWPRFYGQLRDRGGDPDAIEDQAGTYVAMALTRRAAANLARRGLSARTIHSAAYAPSLKYDERLTAEIADAETKIAELETAVERATEAGDDAEVAKLVKKIFTLRGRIEELEDPDWSFSPIAVSKCAAIVVDESTLVSVDMAAELESVGHPVVWIGDPYQLPPIEPGRRNQRPREHFTRENADATLTTVHRQGDNGVLQLATRLRRGEPLKPFEGQDVQVRPTARLLADMEAQPGPFLCERSLFLTDTHERRQFFNLRLREIEGKTTWRPAAGDRILIRRNAPDADLSNGDVITLESVTWERDANAFVAWRWRLAETGDERVQPIALVAKSLTRTYGQHRYPMLNRDAIKAKKITPILCDYGFAITTHSAQGSERDAVVLAGKWLGGKWSDVRMRFVYTALTRARHRARLYVPPLAGVAASRAAR